MNKIVSRLDYAGITILLAGSFYPHIYYAFFCIPGKIYAEFMTLYLSGITGASMFTFCISVIPRFQGRKMRWFRGMLFLLVSILGVIPVGYLVFL